MPTLLERGNLRLGIDEEPSDEIPIEYITSWFRQREYTNASATMQNRVLIVKARTGSGKSTVMPIAIFRILRDIKTPIKKRYVGPGVICTQPRVLTAISLANEAAARPWNPDMVLGVTVGFQTGDISNKPQSGLLYATAGVLAAQLKYSPTDSEIMGKYKFIIIDEAHDRALDSDLTLMLLKNFYIRNVGNKNLPYLVITSATFNTARYADYFGVTSDNVINVAGQTYPITHHWPTTGTNNYPQSAVDTALRIHRENLDDPPERADVMIFMPGAVEMKEVTNLLKRVIDRDSGEHPFLILTLNSEVVKSQLKDFNLLFTPVGELPLVNGKVPIRRIIVTTTVAETGLTIDTLKYVIDCGWNRTKEMYQPWAAEGIITRPAPQNKIEQRRGRCGRLFPGEFYPLYTAAVFKSLELQQLPDIITQGPNNIYLSIVAEQQRQKVRTGATVADFRVEDIALLDPPPPEALLYSNTAAVVLGFISTDAILPSADYNPFDLTSLKERTVHRAAGNTVHRAENSTVHSANSASEQARSSPDEQTLGYGLTSLGFIGASFGRTSMEGVRILLAGYVWDVAADDLITAVAMFGLSVSDLLIGRGRIKKGVTVQLPGEAKVLESVLPTFIRSRFGGGNDARMYEEEGFYFRMKLLLGDNFIESVFICDAFYNKLESAAGDITIVTKWCEEVGLSFDAMIDLTYRRDSIIEEMIISGFNPFRLNTRKLSKLSIVNFTEGVKSFKRCIYDGLRMKTLRYDPKKSAYFSDQGLQVKTPQMFSDNMLAKLNSLNVDRRKNIDSIKPKFICTDQLKLVPVQRSAADAAAPLLYTVETNLVSIMDGYVDPDLSFMKPRTVSHRG
jgi:hypothetical protein